MLIQGRLERTVNNLVYFKWEVTNARKPTKTILNAGQGVNSHFDFKILIRSFLATKTQS